MQQNKLYVGNLSFSVDEAQLRELFSDYGEISELALITDRETGRSKGFAFITFASQQAAEKALEMDGKEIDTRKLRVNVAQERESKGKGKGKGGGDRGGRGGGNSRW